jgi:hypothetical protein
MKLKLPSLKLWKMRSAQVFIDGFKWHVYFCWHPVRVDDHTIAWFENIARRRMMVDVQVLYRAGRLGWLKSPYQYGPIANVLMQPGVIQGVYGDGISAAQAGSFAVQSGPASATGQQVQNVQLQGLANAGAAPPGGLNITPPQPRP